LFSNIRSLRCPSGVFTRFRFHYLTHACSGDFLATFACYSPIPVVISGILLVNYASADIQCGLRLPLQRCSAVTLTLKFNSPDGTSFTMFAAYLVWLIVARSTCYVKLLHTHVTPLHPYAALFWNYLHCDRFHHYSTHTLFVV